MVEMKLYHIQPVVGTVLVRVRDGMGIGKQSLCVRFTLLLHACLHAVWRTYLYLLIMVVIVVIDGARACSVGTGSFIAI